MGATSRELGFIHRFVPGSAAGAPTLLLLHGTGGDENDLIALGQQLLPGAPLLSPRGRVLERGMPRFFRRLAEGVFDQEDLARRTDELVDFIREASAEYRVDPARIVAVGYSNGANIAASVLLRHPAALLGAVLLHPMVPFEPAQPPVLRDTQVFISAGQSDPLVPRRLTERLIELLQNAGARVSVHWEQGGHELVAAEVDAARRWLEEAFRRGSA
ncbi:MAG: alpha/beta hydrolase [Gemmatimonadaceae bacterium]